MFISMYTSKYELLFMREEYVCLPVRLHPGSVGILRVSAVTGDALHSALTMQTLLLESISSAHAVSSVGPRESRRTYKTRKIKQSLYIPPLCRLSKS